MFEADHVIPADQLITSIGKVCCCVLDQSILCPDSLSRQIQHRTMLEMYHYINSLPAAFYSAGC